MKNRRNEDLSRMWLIKTEEIPDYPYDIHVEFPGGALSRCFRGTHTLKEDKELLAALRKHDDLMGRVFFNGMPEADYRQIEDYIYIIGHIRERIDLVPVKTEALIEQKRREIWSRILDIRKKAIRENNKIKKENRR